MPSIPLAQSDYKRLVAKEAEVLLRNRFVENNPVLTDNVVAYIQRPGLRFWQHVGDPDIGQNRKVYSAPGTFDDDLFCVSGPQLWRVDRATGAQTLLADDLAGTETNDAVRMAATGDIGTITPRLWIADGSVLRMYSEDNFSTGTLSGTAIANNDVVRLGSVYYQFTSGSVNAGTPAGTVGNPWLVSLGADLAASYSNLFNAINETGTAGTTYSTALVVNPDARAMYQSEAVGVKVRAVADGVAGDTVATTETGAGIAWTGSTLSGGGAAGVIEVPLPDDVGAIDVAVINNFVIVIPAQGRGINGRFYWINPGEAEIDPLDYATAERSPDPIFQVVVFSDQFWLPGQNTTEVYYMSGDPDAPVTRFQGVVFDRGVHPGCALQVFNSMVLIDSYGGVYQIRGGEKKISTPQIEERIRKAINRQNIATGG